MNKGEFVELDKWVSGESDHLYGRKNPVNLSGVFRHRAARLDPVGEFNNLDRNWRKQYLKDLKLSPNDGNMLQIQKLPMYEKERYNILRRIGRIPFNYFEKAMMGAGVSQPMADAIRRTIAAVGKVYAVTLFLLFQVNDNNINNWESRQTIKMYYSKPPMDPDSPYYESNLRQHNKVTGPDFMDCGFRASPLYK